MTLEYTIRKVQNREEALAVQALDNSLWKNGFQYYERLFEIDPELIQVAVDKETNRLLGYIGFEKFNASDLLFR